MSRRALVAGCLSLLAISSAAAQPSTACPDREYAELKDQAANKAGRISLAYDACRAQRAFDTAKREGDLALQYKMLRDLTRSTADMQACMALRTKITNALSAAKATAAMDFVRGNCSGEYPLK